MPPVAPAPKSPRTFPHVPPWLWIFGISTLAGLFFGAQIYFSRITFGEPVSWAKAFYWSFGDWYEWAILSPAIFWVCRRYSFRREKWLVDVLVTLLSACVISLVHTVMCSIMAWALGTWEGREIDLVLSIRFHIATRMGFNLATYFLICAAWHAWMYQRRARQHEQEMAELANQVVEARLAALRMQLNPHFLFNTLNTISSLMLSDVRAANQMVSRLGSLLRETLIAGEVAEVPLDREIALTRLYLDIEQVRFGGRLKVSVEVEPGLGRLAVPVLLLQPLVENAIRHAVAQRMEGGEIAIVAALEGESLVLEVRDNGSGGLASQSGQRPNKPVPGESIGLSNTRKRLATLYGDKQSFELCSNPQGGMTAVIRIPQHEANLVP